MKLIEQTKTSSSKREVKRYAKATRKSPEKKKMRKILRDSEGNCKDLESAVSQGMKIFGKDNLKIYEENCTITGKDSSVIAINSKKDSKKYTDKIIKLGKATDCELKGIKPEYNYNQFHKKNEYEASAVYGKKDKSEFVSVDKNLDDFVHSRAKIENCKCSQDDLIFQTDKNNILVAKKSNLNEKDEDVPIKSKEFLPISQYKKLDNLEKKELSKMSNLPMTEIKEQHILKIMYDKIKKSK